MQIAIYSPYLDTAGGGEKYVLTIAEVLSKKNKVDILLDQHLFSLGVDEIKKRIKILHNLDLSNVNFVKAAVGGNDNFFKRCLTLKKYDWFFSNTDGSIPYSSAKNSILHFQVPFENSDARGIWGSIRQASWKLAICNSEFTRRMISKNFKFSCKVVYPPVDIERFKVLNKEKQILSVGRIRKEKKHKILIEAFKKLVDKHGLNDWSLHIAGGVYDADKELFEQMVQMARGYKIVFHQNLSVEDLARLYGNSTIYWHATGFEEEDPKLFEHFGITTVESMASGCVPVVIKKGGQIEIVEDGISGFLWDEIDQLIDKTISIIKDPKKFEQLSKKAIQKAQNFSKERFRKKIEEIVYNDAS